MQPTPPLTKVVNDLRHPHESGDREMRARMDKMRAKVRELVDIAEPNDLFEERRNSEQGREGRRLTIMITKTRKSRSGSNYNQPSVRSSISYGETVEYLASRLKTEFPEIAARIDDLPSMRAAAKYAGIIKDPDEIKRLERMHRLADAETWLAVVEWFDEHREPYRGNGHAEGRKRLIK